MRPTWEPKREKETERKRQRERDREREQERERARERERDEGLETREKPRGEGGDEPSHASEELEL